MAYRLLDPPARPRRFNLLERERLFRLMEGGPLDEEIVPDALQFKKDDSWLKTGAKAATRAPFEGVVAAKDLIMGGNAEGAMGKALSWDKNTSWIDRAQDVVDVIGVIDPTGVADLANTLGYMARGKYGHAAISALGIIPYAGDAGKLAKWAARGAGKAGKMTARVAPRISKGAMALEKHAMKVTAKQAEKQAAKVAAKTAGKAATQGAEVAAKGGRFARLKQRYAKGKEIYVRGKAAHERIKSRQAGRAGRARAPEHPPARTSLATPIPGPTAGPQPAGSVSRGDRGSKEVPVDSTCPEGSPTSSTFRASPGMKRCNKGTPGTHGD